jgi:hypothetical protein
MLGFYGGAEILSTEDPIGSKGERNVCLLSTTLDSKPSICFLGFQSFNNLGSLLFSQS